MDKITINSNADNPINAASIYFSGLNGLRTIAALAVVFSHITLQLGAFGLNANLFGTTADGKVKGYLLASYGVTIFFVLSGFLITYLLLVEKAKNPIDIKKFYYRRVLRIWPLYYFYFVLCLVTIAAFSFEADVKSIFLTVFMSANLAAIFNISLPFLSHYWSLAVEEQFYLFWPWLLKYVQKHLVAVLVSLIIIQNLLRIYLGYFYFGSIAFNFSMINRFDCMMIGGLGAYFYFKKWKSYLQIIDNKISQTIALVFIFLLLINKYHINAVVDNFVICIVSLTLIIGQINKTNRVLSLENPIFNFLGKISFGIYIYHPLIIFLFSKCIGALKLNDPIKYVFVYFSIFGITILWSYLSFTYFESYFIRLKHKFTVVASSNSN